MKRFFLVLAISVFFLNCSSDDDDGGGVKNQVLTGTVEGESFTFKGGKAFFTTNFEEEEVVSVNLTNVAVGCESFISMYDLYISVRVPKSIGTHKDVNIVTYKNGNPPFNHLEETIEITALSDTEISGKIKLNNPASGDLFKENIFEGTFTVAICE